MQLHKRISSVIPQYSITYFTPSFTYHNFPSLSISNTILAIKYCYIITGAAAHLPMFSQY